MLKLTQKQLSDSLGFKTSQFISNLERGIAEIPPTRIKEFADILKVESSELARLASESLKRRLLGKSEYEGASADPFMDKFLSAWSTASEQDRELIKNLVSKVLRIDE